MGWRDLDDELKAWEEAGRRADCWWRDDDAVAASPALDRLLDMSARHAAPLAIAVVPASAEASLARRLTGLAGIRVVQHGWSHANHAPIGAKKAELGAHRPTALITGELVRGALALDRLFGPAWLRVLVPPHNRIAGPVAAALPGAGYVGLSTIKARRRRLPGLIEINAHCDIMDWTRRRFVGEDEAIGQVVAHLRARRTGLVDAGEPTGILSHHLALDGPAWAFLEALFARLKGRATIHDPAGLFAS